MWFKNLTILRLAAFDLSADALAQALAKHAFVPCGDLQMQSQGWAPPRDGGDLVHSVNGQLLIALATEKKLLPGSVVRDFVKVRAAELEEQQGFRPGRKQMRELKDAVTDELMPKAFNIRSMTHVWIDPVNGWLVVDAAVGAKVDAVLGELFRAIDGLDVAHLRVKNSPVAAMTDWLATDEAPAGFTIDQDTVLQSSGESRASIRIANQTPDTEDVARHIAAGKRCTLLAMTWNDRVSLVLTDGLVIKRVAPLDVLKETAPAGERGADEAFDSDFLLMTGELARLLADLVDALGGEQVPEAPDDLVSAAEDAESPNQGDVDPLYPQAVEIVQKNKRASISLVQRHLRIGYNRAARLLEQMEESSVVSPMSSDGNRRVLAGAPA